MAGIGGYVKSGRPAGTRNMLKEYTEGEYVAGERDDEHEVPTTSPAVAQDTDKLESWSSGSAASATLPQLDRSRSSAILDKLSTPDEELPWYVRMNPGKRAIVEESNARKRRSVLEHYTTVRDAETNDYREQLQRLPPPPKLTGYMTDQGTGAVVETWSGAPNRQATYTRTRQEEMVGPLPPGVPRPSVARTEAVPIQGKVERERSPQVHAIPSSASSVFVDGEQRPNKFYDPRTKEESGIDKDALKVREAIDKAEAKARAAYDKESDQLSKKKRRLGDPEPPPRAPFAFDREAARGEVESDLLKSKGPGKNKSTEKVKVDMQKVADMLKSAPPGKAVKAPDGNTYVIGPDKKPTRVQPGS